MPGKERDSLGGKEKKSGGKSGGRKLSPAAAKLIKNGPDKYIWGIYLMLLAISCIEVYSASSVRIITDNVYSPLLDHAKFLILGLLITLGLQRVHYKWFKKYAVAFWVLCTAALVYVTRYGADVNGAQRAIDLKIMTIQPPELMKLAMVLFLAKILATNQRPGGVSTKGIVICCLTSLGIAGVLWLNGLTNAIMVFVTSCALLLIGGIEWKKLGIILLIYGTCAYMLYEIKYKDDTEEVKTEQTVAGQSDEGQSDDGTRSDTHKSRISKWTEGVSPSDKITDENRQVMYSRFAIAHGRWMGNGVGNSRESSRLPLAYSDYIYSIIVEDTGFLGGTALLLLYLCLLARAGRIASKCRRAFPALLIMGCAIMIVLQALVHMVIAVGLGPVSGQPLPFISRGGTSIIVMSAAIGMMLSVSKFAVKTNNSKAIKAELNALPDDMHADNPAMIEDRK